MLQDAVAGRLQPLYNAMDDLPHLESQPLPIIPRQQIERVAPTGSRVLIQGPAGSGKEVVARMIHARSRRAEVLRKAFGP